MNPRSITCPACGLTSYHPTDVAEGFCGYCHAWTSRPDLANPVTGALMTDTPYDPLARHPHEDRLTDGLGVEPRPSTSTDWWREYTPAELALAETPERATESAADLLRSYLDAPPLTAPQAQGDVMVMPWPASSVPSYRGTEIDAAADIPDAGVAVTPDGSHWLIPQTPDARPRWHTNVRGYTLGTLVVPVAGAARLSHREHADLLIGPGVYVVRQQRRWDRGRDVTAGD